jgi:hypothetical protein
MIPLFPVSHLSRDENIQPCLAVVIARDPARSLTDLHSSTAVPNRHTGMWLRVSCGTMVCVLVPALGGIVQCIVVSFALVFDQLLKTDVPTAFETALGERVQFQ